MSNPFNRFGDEEYVDALDHASPFDNFEDDDDDDFDDDEDDNFVDFDDEDEDDWEEDEDDWEEDEDDEELDFNPDWDNDDFEIEGGTIFGQE